MTETIPMQAPRAKDWIAAIAAYQPGKAKAADGRRLVKLSANENPLGTGEAARAVLTNATDDLATYPDPASTELRAAIAAVHGLDPERIICGTGSDELLHIAACAYAGPGDEVVHVRYGFSVYEIVTRRAGATMVVAPDRDYGTDVDALLACVTERTTLVFVANPNNPTGTFIPRAEIGRLHAGLPAHVLLVLDQAYAEYLDPEDDDGGMDLARHAPNVLVTRTFSKIHGLAGERIGWGYAAAPVIDMLHRIRGPFNTTTVGQKMAAAAVGDDAFVQRSRAHNSQWRAWFAEQIEALGNHGLRYVPSKANFLLLLFEGAVSAAQASDALTAAGYATRQIAGQGIPQGLRITIGREEDMRKVVAVLRDLLGAR